MPAGVARSISAREDGTTAPASHGVRSRPSCPAAPRTAIRMTNLHVSRNENTGGHPPVFVTSRPLPGSLLQGNRFKRVVARPDDHLLLLAEFDLRLGLANDD